ncbi:MAG TPA: flagellar hook-associated protein FlgL [Candidatus Wunengus sp. YC64]|uniref:flagellar hook-associated protein FlgL n=1 Tax=Candidatus Wunengus sp. YC64 TaxID=3367700 RepID=UPI004024B591
MPFRITQESLNRTTLSNINLNYKKIQGIQEKLSSGKQINRPSDDPSGTRKVLGLRAEELQVQQFLDNTETAKEQINYTSNTLESIQELFLKIKDLAIQAGNDTLGQSDRNIIANELDELLESVLQNANTDNNGRYIFSGTKTLTSAFTATRDSNGNITSVSYNGNNEEIKYQIGPDTLIQVNLPGGKLFQDNKAFSTLISLRDALKASTFDSTAFSNLRNTFDTATNALSTEITKFGAKANRLEMTTNSLGNSQTALKELISYTEDADVASLIVDLQHQENVLQSSLKTGAMVIQQTLLDFLR